MVVPRIPYNEKNSVWKMPRASAQQAVCFFGFLAKSNDNISIAGEDVKNPTAQPGVLYPTEKRNCVNFFGCCRADDCPKQFLHSAKVSVLGFFRCCAVL